GYGSGVGGHTIGRGMKGQNSRSSVPLWFEGGQLPLVKRMPFLRGKDRFKSNSQATTIVNLKELSQLDTTEVTKDTLVKAGIITVREATQTEVKILGSGDVSKKFSIKGLVTSASAKTKIEKAGGSVESL